jgi:hypothetical protein
LCFPCRQGPSQYTFEGKSPYIDCFIKELGIANSLDNLQYTANCTYYEILENQFLYRVPLEFQPQMKNWIFHHLQLLRSPLLVINGMHAHSLDILWGVFQNRTPLVMTIVQFMYRVEWWKIQFLT